MNSTPQLRNVSAICFFLAAVALPALVHGAAAVQYPTRPVRLVVPFAAGGGADTLSRIIAPKLSDALGQTWVVDNRGGAAGNLAAEIIADAAPDGHTVFMGFSTVLTVNPSLYKLRWTVEKNFQAVSLLATAQYILVIHPSVKAGTVKELTALAKQNPKTLNYASAGVGSPLHLAAELFKKRADVNMVHLPYKGGGPAAAAVLAGEAHVIFGSVASSMPHVKAGRLKALATTGAKRSKVAPELPTLAESGFPGFNVTSWYAFLVPGKTPAAIVRLLHDEAVKAVALFDVQQAMSRQGLEAETSSPQQLSERIKAETAMWAEVIKSAGIKAE